MNNRKLVLIGSMTHSIATYDNEVKERFGGGVFYGGQTASKLGIPTTVITIGADDLEPGLEDLKKLGIKTIRVKRDVSNNFSNDYRGDQRKLYMRSFIKTPFSTSDFSRKINCDALVIFPGLNEIPANISSFLDTKIVFLDVGGLSRKLGKKDSDGLFSVIQSYWESIDEFRGKIDILKVSHEDLENIKFPTGVNTEGEKIQNLANNGFQIIALTRGEKPTFLARKGMSVLEVPTFRVNNADPAGAGEAFSVGFIFEYLKTNDPVKSTAFANACASFHVSKENYSYEEAKKRTKQLLQLI